MQHLHAVLLERARQGEDVADVIVDQQHLLAVELPGTAGLALLHAGKDGLDAARLDRPHFDAGGLGFGHGHRFVRRLVAQRQVEPEGAALPLRARHADFAP